MGQASAPVLQTPANASTVDTNLIYTYLRWDRVETVTNYEVQVSTSSTFSGYALDTTIADPDYYKQYYPPANGTYYWRVRSKNLIGWSPWTTGWSFSFNFKPTAPALQLPLADYTVIGFKDTLIWNPVSGATGFRLQLSTSDTFAGAAVVLDTIMLPTVTRVLLSNLPKVTYYWRVMTQKNPFGWGSWSQAKMFKAEALQWSKGLDDQTLDIQAFATFNGKLYAASTQGVWEKSSAAGVWSNPSTGFGADLLSLASNGQTLFAGTKTGKVFKSTDGATWTLASTIALNYPVNCLVYDGTYLYAGLYTAGFYRSSDDGASWVSMRTGNDFRMFKGTNALYSSILDGLVKYTTDYGSTWTTLNVPGVSTSNFAQCFCQNGGNLYVGSGGAQVISHTANNGTTWTIDTTGLAGAYYVLTLSPIASGTLMVAGTGLDGVYISNSNNIVWKRTEFGANGIINQANCSAEFDGSVFIGTQSGIYQAQIP
jgi:hypothetical protein